MVTRRYACSVAIGVILCSTIPAGRAGAADDETAARCRQILQEALEDENPALRKQGVLALSLLGTEYLSALSEMLHDDDVEVRLAAVDSLTEVKSPKAVQALRDALNDEVPEVSFAAAKALWGVRDGAGREALLAVLAGESKTSSNFIAKQKREVARTVRSKRALLLFAVRRSIGYAPVPYLGLGVASMQGLLNDPSVSGRATAALMLAHERDKASRQALQEALTDKDWSVRAAAVHALAVRRVPGLKTDLTPLLDDENPAVAGYLSVGTRRERPTPRVRSADTPALK
jgi:HEAT repeat protein